jgi:hypothetical protein
MQVYKTLPGVPLDGASSEWHAVPHQRINAGREKQGCFGPDDDGPPRRAHQMQRIS